MRTRFVKKNVLLFIAVINLLTGVFAFEVLGCPLPPPYCGPCGCNGCGNCYNCQSDGCHPNDCGKCKNCNPNTGGCENRYAEGCETCNESDGAITGICNNETETCCPWGEYGALHYACYDTLCKACTATGPVDIDIISISVQYRPATFICSIETNPPERGCSATWTWTGSGVGWSHCDPRYDPYCCPNSVYNISFSSCGLHTITASICSSSQSVEVNVPPCKVSTWAELETCDRVDDPCTEPNPNGCSVPPSLCWLFGVDCDNPAGCENTSFLDACNQHDVCYQTCNHPKSDCDDNVFYNALATKCNGVPPGTCHDSCIDYASKYVTAVEEVGLESYHEDQIAQCACCDWD